MYKSASFKTRLYTYRHVSGGEFMVKKKSKKSNNKVI